MNEEPQWVTGSVTLSIDGNPLTMEMTVPTNRVKPQRMLPIFQQMTNSFVEMGVGAARSDGLAVSCKAGCGACCRQMVPLAEIEAYRIAEMVDGFEEPRRGEIRGRFEAAFETLAATDLFHKLSSVLELEPAVREELVLEYFRMGIPCPFLENESCSIHEDRPLSCREYLVSSDPANCATNLTATGVKTIEIPVKPSKTLRRLGQTRRIVGADFIPLILALKWAETNPDAFAEKTGEEWMAEFFGILTKSEISAGNSRP
jgi:Fe-S-cluster containining protein